MMSLRSFQAGRWAWQVLRCASSSADIGVAMGQSAHSAQLSRLPVKTLGRLLAQPGALNSVDFEVAARFAMQRIEDMDGKDCIRVLGALKDIPGGSRPDAAALQSLGIRLSERLGDISTNNMAQLAEDLASVSAPVAPVFARLSAAFSNRVSAANPRQLTKVASAFARARLADRRLMPRLAQGALKQLHLFTPEDLSAFMSSFAAVGLCHEPLLTGSAKVVAQLGPRLSATDLALVAFSYAQFFLVFPSVVSLLEERLPSCAHELPPERLAELSVSCARLDVRPTNLLSVFARNLELSYLSNELFGQVSKSLALLGLAASPSIQSQLEQECRRRLDELRINKVNTDGLWWTQDVLECLAAAAEECRLNHGGVVPPFWQRALDSLCPLLLDLIPNLTAIEAATCYRSLRQLPPSLVRLQQSTWSVHEQLALRCLGLASVEAFSFLHLTSVVYSQFCLYPELCLQQMESSEGLTNPTWTSVFSSWKATSDAWVSGLSEAERLEGPGQFQAAVLSMVFEREGFTTRQEAKHRPVALELQEHLRLAGWEVEGPLWEGPFEIHAVSGKNAFCLMPKEAYFRRQDGILQESSLELCHERFAQIALLKIKGWNALPVAFETWRRLSSSKRQALIEEMLKQKEVENCSMVKHGQTVKPFRVTSCFFVILYSLYMI